MLLSLLLIVYSWAQLPFFVLAMVMAGLSRLVPIVCSVDFPTAICVEIDNEVFVFKVHDNAWIHVTGTGVMLVR